MNRGLRLPVFLSIYFMSLKFKKLSLQYSYLKLEKEEVDENCSSSSKEMEEYIRHNYPDVYDAFFAPEPVPEQEPKEDTNDETINEEAKKHPEKNKDLKLLYRKIASRTHPDKTANLQYHKIFAEAAEAYNNNDIGKILDLAGSLNLEIIELSKESVLLLELNIKKLNEYIQCRKSSPAWAWSQTTTDEEKQNIILFMMQNKGIKP